MAVTMKITVLYMLWKNSTRESNESCMPNGRKFHSKTPENTDLLFLWPPKYLPGYNTFKTFGPMPLIREAAYR